MTGKWPRLLAFAGLAVVGFAACILDLDGLSSGPPRAEAEGGADVASPLDAASADTGSEASGGACPGTEGPAAVRVGSGASSFCIDATEVTNMHYARFLASSPPTTGQLPACSDNTSFVPGASWPGNPDLPVVAVDWCDAYAFCAWAGKALCGRIGGGHLDGSARNDASQSQWYFACTAAGANAYPYGASFDANACVTSGPLIAAGSKKTCEGGFSGVLDLSGSVEEWVDECTPDFADCFARGGSHVDTKGFECATDAVRAQPRMLQEGWRGFRCCSPG